MKIIIKENLPNLNIKGVDSLKIQAIYIYLIINSFNSNIVFMGHSFKAGEVLTTIKELAKFLNSSQTTITKILKYLTEKSYINKAQLFINNKNYTYITMNNSDSFYIQEDI